MGLVEAKAILGWTADTVFHVGAHNFEELDDYQALGCSRVVWFDPICSRKTSSLPISHKFFPVAIALAPATRNFYRYDATGFSSLLELPAVSPIIRISPNLVEKTRVETAPLAPFQEEFPRSSPDESRALIVDVQGAEAEVMLSANLSDLDIVIVETSRRWMYAGSGNSAEFIESLLSFYGFHRHLSLTDPIFGHGEQYYARSVPERRRRVELDFGLRALAHMSRGAVRRTASGARRRLAEWRP